MSLRSDDESEETKSDQIPTNWIMQIASEPFPYRNYYQIIADLIPPITESVSPYGYRLVVNMSLLSDFLHLQLFKIDEEKLDQHCIRNTNIIIV